LKILGAALQADGETRSVVTASSIRRRSAAWTILLDWTYRSRRPASALWMTRADRAGSEGSERARSSAAGSGEPHLPLQADRTGSRASIAMAFQRACRSRPGAMFARFTLNSRHQM